jgi:tetratricopeptide (TPR) repeat protein
VTVGEPSAVAGSAVDRAKLMLDVGRGEDAVALLTAHLAEHAEDTSALSLLAWAQLRCDRPAEALAATESALAVEPDHLGAWQRRSQALSALGRHDEAVWAGRRCVELAPDSWTTHYTYGLALRKVPGQEAMVLAAANRSVALAPGNPDTHVLLGLAYGGLGNSAAAEQCYRRALAIDPEHTYARSNLSTLDLRRGRFGAALAGFRAAASTDPQETLFHRNIAATVLSALIKRGYLLALITVFGTWIVVNALFGALPSDAGADAPTDWPLRTGLGVAAVVAWAVLVGVKLRPLSRYLRGHVRRVLGSLLRTARFAWLFGGCLVSQVCVLLALFGAGLGPDAVTGLSLLGLVALLLGNLGSRFARIFSRRRN